MNKRQVGSSDLFVSEIGLGCMSLGTDEKHAKSIVDHALDLGINFFDTADLYDFGVNEEIVGKALKNRRHDIILATKVGNRWSDNKDGWYWDASKQYIIETVKDNLRRLQTDYIDLYQLHGGTIEDHIDDTIDAFEQLKREGVIRQYGISSIRPNVIREFVNKSSIVSVMMQYSVLDRRPEELFSMLQKNNIHIIARGPLAKGILTEKPLMNAGKKVLEKGYLHYTYEELSHVRSEVTAICNNRSLTEIALQYCLHSSEVATVIPGASRNEQLIENVEGAATIGLTNSQYSKIQEVTKTNKYELHR
ncbi:aldo/keto reductase [Bacillus sp. SM2101]|uniref:aldo/keto reductase n=1 Tax=Bacillus sp. SM2101 TaxID=2805366 RepID=UPI001BDF3B0F|nr:aldo/keto reductase [Bacillus sp. SM2101]